MKKEELEMAHIQLNREMTRKQQKNKNNRKMTVRIAPAEILPKVTWVQRAGRSKVKHKS